MTHSENSKVQNAINDILKKDISRKNVTETELTNMINAMDKNEITKKLNSMGLSFISDKIRNTSNEEIAKIIKNNPGLIDKINNYLK